jgi:hypothetical protein
VLTLAQGGESDQLADVGTAAEGLTDFCVEHVLELVWGDEKAHGVCAWFWCGAGGSASRQNHSSTGESYFVSYVSHALGRKNRGCHPSAWLLSAQKSYHTREPDLFTPIALGLPVQTERSSSPGADRAFQRAVESAAVLGMVPEG